MHKKWILGGAGLIMIIGLIIVSGVHVADYYTGPADARSMPETDPAVNLQNLNIIQPAERFNTTICGQQGDPEVFYNIGEQYDYLPASEVTSAYAHEYQQSLTLHTPDEQAGVVLGYRIAQENDTDPCDCFIDTDGDGDVEPPPLCPEPGCVVSWQSPAAQSELSGSAEFVMGIDPTIACTELYIWAYADADKTTSLGWLDCGSEGFTLGTDNLWYGECDLTPLHAYDQVYLQPRGNGCYHSIYLTDDPVNNENDGSDEENPLYGPFNLPGPQPPEYCDPSWQCDDWSNVPCVNGQQIRTCVDLNECGVTVNRPNLVRSCNAPDAETDVTSPSTDIREETVVEPSVVMTIPKEGDVITGSITLTAKVTGTISTLDFFWDAPESANATQRDVLIGAGRSIPTNKQIWEKSWDTTQTPSNEYQVYARIQDEEGDYYLSNKVSITLNHEIDQELEDVPSASDNPDATTDTDNEGAPDIVENEIGTSINNPDTDGDGVTDYDEIINESNPLGEGTIDALVTEGKITAEKVTEVKATLEKIAFEEPKTSGVAKPHKLSVLEVANVSEHIGQNKIIFRGRGPANTYLSLFIYSTPIVVTTKTDASGNFTYSLDKHLVDGEHEVYVTVTDDTGKIQEKSSPFTFFVRKAEAVSEEEYFRADVNVQSDTATTVNTYLWLALALVAAAIILLLVAYVVGRKK